MVISGETTMIKMKIHYRDYLPLLLSFLVVVSCTHNQQRHVTQENEDYVEKEAQAEDRFSNIVKPEATGPEIPEFIPVKEDSSPLTTKKVSVAARNTPLRDVLFTIARTANLNLAMQRGVEPEIPVTMTFNDLSVAQALELIFDSVDYFYTIKENILIVKAMDTRIFEFGQPSVIQDFKLSVGGDILSGTSSSGGAKTALSGDLSINTKADGKSFQFWDGMEASLATLLSIDSEGQASFTINRMAGTIMVTAAKKELQKVHDFITNVSKVLNRQVYIEARIIEVQLSEGLKYGIDWSNVVKDIAGTDVSHGTDFFSNVVSDDGPNYMIFNINGDDDFNFLLRALQDRGDVKTLSNPRVSIMNGQTSMLSVGRNTSFISSVETTITTSEGSVPIITFTVETNSILSGVLFGLVPYINSEGEITLTITPIITTLVNLETKEIGTNGTDTIPAIELTLPTVDLREMTTTVKVQDGQMIIIGGLIDKKEIVRENRVPLLGDIPLLGHVFRSVDRSEEKTELVIILMPRILG
jgi:MSHA type pilus biogenesis protein MshL